MLPGFHQDLCGGGLWDGGSRRIVTIVNASGELIANVWITLVPYYNACDSDNTEPSFPPPTETGPTGPSEFTLTVDNQPNGDGSVTSSPPGIDCPLDCTQTFAAGTPVTLQEQPTPFFFFDHWSGDCTGSDTSCTVTMDADRSVVANYGGSGPPPPPPSGTGGGGGGGSTGGGG